MGVKNYISAWLCLRFCRGAKVRKCRNAQEHTVANEGYSNSMHILELDPMPFLTGTSPEKATSRMLIRSLQSDASGTS